MRLAPAVAAFCAAASAAASVAPPSFALQGPAVQGGLVRGRAPAGAAALFLDAQPVPLAPDGRFVIGFDRDHPRGATLSAGLADGRTIRQTLSVTARAWRIEHVDVAQRPSVPDEAYRRRRAAELERIRAARAQRTGAGGWQQRFIWPARGRISGLFGAQRVFRGVPAAYHSGVDVAGGAGAPVVAPADGVVVLVGPPMFSLEGNLVIIDHGMGLNSAFLHLATSEVAVGQRVRRGQRIGSIGMTGRATGPHLHWGMMWNAARIDPQLVAGPM